ncbi:hypothetical protein GGR93_001066 [Sulfitobacter noctilucicola]|uniref:Flippase-like domain-containing protein n=1 Tax=Sulfitobacter noctilucicola TaxID=1342301 RepID=A0A7W6Q525_9RHOB|nr:hypothetical protein [Sulfitobacter noctilucicola]
MALTCLGYLVVQRAPKLPPLELSSPVLWAALAVSLFCYVLSQCAAAEAWRSILSLWAVRIAPKLAWGQTMVSQIGKYIPGNVAHLFGRVVIARRDGVASSVLAASMVLEVAVTLGVGLAVAGVLFIVEPDAIPNLAATYPDFGAQLLPVLFAVVVAIGVGAGVIVLKSRLQSLGVKRPSVSDLVRPLALHLASFVILGVSLWAAALAIAPDFTPDLVTCTLIFALAWAAGFIVPGAPGGIGIRDSIIVLGLAVSMGEGSGLAVALLHRAISICGDVITFAIGWNMRRVGEDKTPSINAACTPVPTD